MLLMVLNDGETYTDLAGCMIVEAPDDYDLEGIEGDLRDLQDRPFLMDVNGPERLMVFVKGHTFVLQDKAPMRQAIEVTV